MNKIHNMSRIRMLAVKFLQMSLILLSMICSQVKANELLLAHITADKPSYRPGDTAFIEVFVFDAVTKKPFECVDGCDASMVILDAKL